RFEGLAQAADHQFVEGVALLGAIERHHRHAFGRDIEKHGVGRGAHALAPMAAVSAAASACGRSASGGSNNLSNGAPAKKYSKSSGAAASSMNTGTRRFL